MEQAGVEWCMYNYPKHNTITSVGSRGDVQPFIALALRLKIRGHQVRLVTSTIFEEMSSAYGLEFVGINVGPRQMLQDDVRKLGVPSITTHQQPMNPTRAFPPPNSGSQP